LFFFPSRTHLHLRTALSILLLIAAIANTACKVKWTQNAETVVRGNGSGSAFNQFGLLRSFYVDDDQTVFITDCHNNRIVEWKPDTTSGQVVAGGNGPGNRTDQLNCPMHVIIDKETNSLITRGSPAQVHELRSNERKNCSKVLFEQTELFKQSFLNELN
jgi:hypothetical protein